MRIVDGQRFCIRGHHMPPELCSHRIHSGNGRPYTICKTCRRLDRNKWDKKRKAQRRAHGLPANRQQHKNVRSQIPPSVHANLIEVQGGKCAICKQQRPLVADHDHVTLAVRGMLCRNCNFALGFFGDDRERIASALNYLADPPVKDLTLPRKPESQRYQEARRRRQASGVAR